MKPSLFCILEYGFFWSLDIKLNSKYGIFELRYFLDVKTKNSKMDFNMHTFWGYVVIKKKTRKNYNFI